MMLEVQFELKSIVADHVGMRISQIRSFEVKYKFKYKNKKNKNKNNGNCSQGDLCQHGIDYNPE